MQNLNAHKSLALLRTLIVHVQYSPYGPMYGMFGCRMHCSEYHRPADDPPPPPPPPPLAAATAATNTSTAAAAATDATAAAVCVRQYSQPRLRRCQR